MPSGPFTRQLLRASALASALALCPAIAADRPATAEGAQKLQDLFAKYLPGAGAAPALKVTPESDHYRITVDLSAVNALTKGVGASYVPAAIVYKATEQDDGKWRVALESLPKIVF
ncbi:MAG: hypothetical protein JO312_00540, partial [Hyphomicrobiales bacterium]|nr:hypothetical protein [Hyphomicrobiales bacterium]